MGWIKVRLDDDAHETVRELVANDDRPTHDVVGDIVEDNVEDYANAD